MAKLFAFEELDEVVGAGEMETDVEVGEVSDVETEIADVIQDTDTQAVAIGEAEDAGEDLEEVQDMLEEVQEDGEGIDPIAAESLRIALSSICKRIGASPSRFYSLCATENFQSVSSRRANTQIVLEGVGEFLKELWAKVRAAILNLWKKITDFWDKHVSSLGRVLKAIESMKKKVSASSGNYKSGIQVEKAPANLVSAFPNSSSNVSVSVVKDYIKAHTKAEVVAKAVSDRIEKLNTSIGTLSERTLQSDLDASIQTFKSTGTMHFGSKDAPLVGGEYITYKFTAESDNKSKVELEVEKETVDTDMNDPALDLTGKSELSAILDSTKTIIKDTINYKKKVDKINELISKNTAKVSSVLDKITQTNKEAAGDNADQKKDIDKNYKDVREKISSYNSFNTKSARINTDIYTYNVKLAKAVLAFCSVNLKNYKAK